jgi:hypothetical protein
VLKAGVFSARTMRKLAAGFVELNWLFIMLNSILLSAALLLGGPSVSARELMVEPQVMAVPVSATSLQMSDATLTYLIERRAAVHWNLSIATAWAKYNGGQLKIVEIQADVHYMLIYGDGILDTIIDPSDM